MNKEERNIKISIIMPVYNVEKYLEESLNSILSQSFQDIEVICVDDGSTDKSLELLKDYEQKDKRIIVVSQENQGQGVARNRALEIASGEYILFCDPDDYFEKNAFVVLYEEVKKTKLDIVMFDYNEIDECGNFSRKRCFCNKLKNKNIYSVDDIKKLGLKKIPKAVWRYFYSRDFLNKYNLKFTNTKIGEDIVFSLSGFLNAGRCGYLQECLYNYRIRKGSAVEVASDRNFEIFIVIDEIKKVLEEKNMFIVFKNSYYDYIVDIMAVRLEKVPSELEGNFKIKCKSYLRNYFDYKKLEMQSKRICSFNEWVFSIKNRRKNGVKYKQITFLGIIFLLRCK